MTDTDRLAALLERATAMTRTFEEGAAFLRERGVTLLDEADESVVWSEDEARVSVRISDALWAACRDRRTLLETLDRERAAQPAPLDERYRALVGKLDATNIGGHPLAGYSAQRRLGWDEAMATVRTLLREDSDA